MVSYMPRKQSFAKSYLRTRVSGQMTSTCQVWTPALLNYETRGENTSQRDFSPYKYVGPCTITGLSANTSSYINDAAVAQTSGQLILPWDSFLAEPADWVKLITCPDDVSLEGRTLKIESAARGGRIRGSRSYVVTFIESAMNEEW